MTPLCAICCKRDATEETDWDDGKVIWVCAECMTEPGECAVILGEPSVAEETMRVAMRSPGATMSDVADALGYLNEDDRNAVSRALYRATRLGVLRVEEHQNIQYYYPTAKRCCQRCSKAYSPTRGDQKYCSRSCAKLADHERRGAA